MTRVAPPLDDARRRLLPVASAPSVKGDGSTTVASVTHHSRAVVPLGMYACLRGEHHDGHMFAPDAVAAGAASLLVDHPLAVEQIGTLARAQMVSQLVVDDTRRALGPVAAAVHGDPSTALRVVGITGTNGKTTTSLLVASILRAAGDPTSVIGTLSGVHTTPEAPELQARLAGILDNGDRSVVMEVSSHALALHRVDGTRFDAAVFTNLGRDHLDLHHTVEEYFRAKASLFRSGTGGRRRRQRRRPPRSPAVRRRADRDGAVLARRRRRRRGGRRFASIPMARAVHHGAARWIVQRRQLTGRRHHRRGPWHRRRRHRLRARHR